ncbi:nitric oxide reductase transcriptional regulator NorR [Aliivibrio fischeri]|uniref:nitric oxide reductase transcriptional regulator NorR n=1 Tax=Aliivibrio fischeri TaxID=668 RepID=UPI001665CF63|nr:nitric oxide reductase transcriptional regulator NorR [Aliivibrio fischeri]USR98030.1 nitric oxide reductase transcriptional regulator NorR [Aliivibrio fischeri ATCC 7744 = JCM 18803 = DSM 507]GGK41107.1 anaerobic nitric oxide reductase transcription regulator [Aliivibrio fischeri]
MKPSIEKVLLQIALDLSSNLSSDLHYQRLINSIHQVFPCDASALFILDNDHCLKPVAVKGLSQAVLGRCFPPQVHPRLEAILQSKHPVRFESNSDLPDPFDGLLLVDESINIEVHDCLGCSLYVEDTLVGVLTLDALEVGAFKKIDDITIETFAALAAATLHNKALIKTLQDSNQQQKSINQTLIQQARIQKGELIGISPQITRLKSNISTVAHSDYAVLISGETGSGKELVAHSVHAQSQRNELPMIYVNCAALPESLAESELFGHVKGAFTGANNHRAGKFELADKGTLFLDEIGELPLLIQAKLLRVIQQGEVQRVGSDKNVMVNVRIIAATNRNLEKEVEEGRFRADLFHRLNVFPIHVPPLREREGDISVLSGYLLDKVRTQFNVPNLHIHPKTLTHLESSPWLGNIRELEHTLMRAGLRAIQENANSITLAHFLGDIENTEDVKNTSHLLPNKSQPMRELVESYQKQLIEHALSESNGVWAKAAEFLQMDRGNLYRMGKKLGISN